jgi:hypothetical protein
MGQTGRTLLVGILAALLASCGNGSAGSFSIANPVLFLSKSELSFSTSLGGPTPAPQSVDIASSGIGQFDFTASSDSPWLLVTPTSGSSPDTLLISVKVGNMSGTFTGHIAVVAKAFGSPGTITVTLIVAP